MRQPEEKAPKVVLGWRLEEASIIITQYIIAILFPIWDILKNAVKEFFHFIAKLIARSFCGFSLPTATRSAGLAVGVPPCGRHFPSLRQYQFYRFSQQRRTSLRMSFVFSCIRDKSAHNPLIPNICIQTSHKGVNFSLFERGQSLPCKREGDRRRRWRDSISRRGPERQNPPVTA